jgi:hypothetical protein
MNDVITARAAFDPLLEKTHQEALFDYLNSITRLFNPLNSEKVSKILIQLIKRQHELLIEGKIKGKLPIKVDKYNGIAYLQG